MGYLLGIDYDEMRTVAREITARAGSLQSIAGSVAARNADALAVWRGLAANVYTGQCERAQARAGRVAGRLEDVAAALRFTADIIEAAERRARQELEQRMRSQQGQA